MDLFSGIILILGHQAAQVIKSKGKESLTVAGSTKEAKKRCADDTFAELRKGSCYKCPVGSRQQGHKQKTPRLLAKATETAEPPLELSLPFQEAGLGYPTQGYEASRTTQYRIHR